MSHKVNLSFLNPESNEQEVIEGEFTPDEWRSLELFFECAEQLFTAKFARTGIPVDLKIRMEGEPAQIVYETKLPDWDEVTILLHKIRPFILTDERTNCNNIRKVLDRRLDNKTIRRFLNYQKDVFIGKRFQSMTKMQVNEDFVLNSEKSLNLWLNAHEYHRNLDGREELQKITEFFPFDAARAIFLLVLDEKIKAIHGVGVIVASVLGKQPKVTISVR